MWWCVPAMVISDVSGQAAAVQQAAAGRKAAATEAAEAAALSVHYSQQHYGRCSQHYSLCEERTAEAQKCKDSCGRMDVSDGWLVSQKLARSDSNGQP